MYTHIYVHLCKNVYVHIHSYTYRAIVSSSAKNGARTRRDQTTRDPAVYSSNHNMYVFQNMYTSTYISTSISTEMNQCAHTRRDQTTRDPAVYSSHSI